MPLHLNVSTALVFKILSILSNLTNLNLTLFFSEHNGSLLSKNRPFALWETSNCLKKSPLDVSTMKRDATPDQWGRSTVFSRVPPTNVTSKVFSSSDQTYHTVAKDSSAEMILESFIDSHWLENTRSKRKLYSKKSDFTTDETTSSADINKYIEPPLL